LRLLAAAGFFLPSALTPLWAIMRMASEALDMYATNMNAILPDELQALKTLVLEQQGNLAVREAEIEHLKFVIAKLRRMEFGRRSERMSGMIGQLELSRSA
jgi:hypothetical protein